MITAKNAADAVNYLFAAQAVTAVENMDAVWADYVNSELPDLNPADLLPAARLCLKTWAREQRSWKVDLPRFTEACRAIRSKRLEEYIALHGRPTPSRTVCDDGALYLAWKRAATDAVLRGAKTPTEVDAVAYKTLGLPVPAPEITEHYEHDYRIGKTL